MSIFATVNWIMKDGLVWAGWDTNWNHQLWMAPDTTLKKCWDSRCFCPAKLCIQLLQQKTVKLFCWPLQALKTTVCSALSLELGKRQRCCLQLNLPSQWCVSGKCSSLSTFPKDQSDLPGRSLLAVLALARQILAMTLSNGLKVGWRLHVPWEARLPLWTRLALVYKMQLSIRHEFGWEIGQGRNMSTTAAETPQIVVLGTCLSITWSEILKLRARHVSSLPFGPTFKATTIDKK